jgi:hypothetical protein
MLKNEYFTVKNISEKFEVSSRNVRRIIAQLEQKTSNDLLYKDNNHIWQIHHLLLPKFKPQRKRLNKYYALTIDPCTFLSEKDIIKIMQFVFDKTDDNTLEINYSVEQKKSNGQNHIHCYIKCKSKKALLNIMKLGFGKMNYLESRIYDFSGWRSYMSKESNITTLKKEENGNK